MPSLMEGLSSHKSASSNAYDPHRFWRIIFARRGSGIPIIMPRALVMMPIPIGIAILEHYDKLGSVDVQYDNITLPFAVILSLLMAFRIGDAFRKWQRADMCTQMLHSGSRTAIGKMCAYLEHTDENVAAINDCLLYTSPSPRDRTRSRMPSSA